MTAGKTIRLSRILSDSGHTVIVALDHAVSSGPIAGLESLPQTLTSVSDAADAVVLNKGPLQDQGLPQGFRPSVILQVSAGVVTGAASQRAVVVRVEEAVKLGADCIAFHLDLGGTSDHSALCDLGRVSAACSEFGMPLLVMAYRHPYASVTNMLDSAHLARVAAELGADIVKVPMPSSTEQCARIAAVCHVPVVLAGGSPNAELTDYVRRVDKAMKVGIAGVCVGRFVFQSGDPAGAVAMLRSVVHGRAGVGREGGA